MTDFKLKYQNEYFTEIEKYYSHLQDGERSTLMYLRNRANGGQKLSHDDFSKLQDLANKCKVNYKRD